MNDAAIIGRVRNHKDRPERLCFMRPDGSPNTWFRADETRAEVAECLAAAGLLLRDDDTVVRA